MSKVYKVTLIMDEGWRQYFEDALMNVQDDEVCQVVWFEELDVAREV